MAWYLAYIQLLAEELNDLGNPLTIALLSCGADYLADIRLTAQDLAAGTSIQSSCARLQAFLDVTHKNMTTAAPPALTGWMRLYADASILRSLADVCPSTAAQSIAALDRAIIVSGPAGGRLDLVLLIIETIQRKYLPICPFKGSYSLRNRRRSNVGLHTSTCDIPFLSASPSLFAFQSHLRTRPFILRGYARDWPAMQEHPWSSAAYLRSASGPGRIVPVEVGGDYRTYEWTQMLMGWDDFLASLDLEGQAQSQKPSDTMYLAQHNLLMQFPALRADIIVPDYVFAPADHLDIPDYRPPGNDEQLVINAWLGPKGTVSPAHTDPYHNFFAQVVGRKTVWLAPPHLTPFMYPYSSPGTNNHSHNPASNSINPSLSNTSRVDVFATDETNEEKLPDFWDHVVPKAMNGTLEPGDLLFIPPGWWHGMRSEGTSFSVSMWF